MFIELSFAECDAKMRLVLGNLREVVPKKPFRNLLGLLIMGEHQRQTIVRGARAVNYYREVSFWKTLSRVVDSKIARDSRECKRIQGLLDSPLSLMSNPLCCTCLLMSSKLRVGLNYPPCLVSIGL